MEKSFIKMVSKRNHSWQLAVAILWILAGCAGPVQNAENGSGQPHLCWPGPPHEARIVWSGSIASEDLVGGNRGFWSWLGSLFIGRERPHILRPYGVYAEQGKLFIADPGGGAVHVVDLETRKHRLLQPRSEEPFASPIGVSGDGRGGIFFTDSMKGKVFRYDLGTEELRPFNRVPLGRPTGIAYSSNSGLLYVADTSAHAVIALGLDGKEHLRFGGRGAVPGTFNFPTDLFVDRRGRLWVTDAMNFRIQAFSGEGKFIKMFGTQGDTSGRLAKPKGVAVDGDGNVYSCDSLFDTVQIFDESGRLLLWFGEKGTKQGEFWMPSGIYIDERNTIFVTDTYNRRIQIFRYLESKINK